METEAEETLVTTARTALHVLLFDSSSSAAAGGAVPPPSRRMQSVSPVRRHHSCVPCSVSPVGAAVSRPPGPQSRLSYPSRRGAPCAPAGETSPNHHVQAATGGIMSPSAPGHNALYPRDRESPRPASSPHAPPDAVARRRTHTAPAGDTSAHHHTQAATGGIMSPRLRGTMPCALLRAAVSRPPGPRLRLSYPSPVGAHTVRPPAESFK